MAMAQFIYTMHKVGRFHPPDRQVLDNITLSFFPGAKIGVLGSNGAGKSSLLRIMAGVDDGFTGDARLTAGFTVGHLEQEPVLDPAKDVQGNVMDGAGETVQLLADYDAVLAGWSDPDADYEKLGARTGPSWRSKIEAANGWDVERTDRDRHGRLSACRPKDESAVEHHLSGGERRRVALCSTAPVQKPDLLLLDEPTNHLDAESVAWLERHLSSSTPGTVIAVTHDRYFLDNVAQLDPGTRSTVTPIPYEGNYSSGWLEQKHCPSRLPGASARHRPGKRTLKPGSWSGSGCRPRPARQRVKARLTRPTRTLVDRSAEGSTTIATRS